jgi:hypothetical protein
MLTCKACQKEFQGNAQYCPSCGSKLELCDHIDNAKQDITKEPKENDDNRLGNKQDGRNNVCAVCGTEGTVDGSMVINRFTGEEITNRNLNYFLALLYYLISLAVSIVAGYFFIGGIRLNSTLGRNDNIFTPLVLIPIAALPLAVAANKKMDNGKYTITIPRYTCSYCKYSWGDESQIRQKVNDDFEKLSESQKQHIEKLREEVNVKRQKEIEYKKDYIRSNPHLFS